MIPVRRTEKPRVLVDNADTWLTELKHIKASSNPKKADIDKAVNKYSHPEIKSALASMFNGKCAYCEGKVRAVDRGDIEHFYPKSKYVNLIFEWTNLLYSCSFCNRPPYKGDNFPLDDQGVNPILIDPTNDSEDPFLHLDFSWEQDIELAIVDVRDDRGIEVVRTFDLNGERGREDLIEERTDKALDLLSLLALALNEDFETREKAISFLKRKCSSTTAYLAFIYTNILPYLAHYFCDPESIDLYKQICQRSQYVCEILSLREKVFLEESPIARKVLIENLKRQCKSRSGYSSFSYFLVLPYLAHHYKDLEAIALLREKGQHDQAYTAFARIDKLPMIEHIVVD